MSDDGLRKDIKTAGTIAYGRFPPAAFKPHHVTPVRVRLIKGEYRTPDGGVAGYHKVWKHYNRKARKYQICSSTWATDPTTGTEVRTGGKQCVGCFVMYDNNNPVAPSGVQVPRVPVSIQRHYVFSTYVMNDFHLDPTKKDGTPLGTDDEGKPKLRRVMCTRHSDCQGCQRGQEKEWGRRMRWDLAKKYVEILFAHLDQHDRTCAGCGSVYDEDNDTGGLDSSIICANCNAVINKNVAVDIRNSLLDPGSKVRCDKCTAVMTPREALTCASCQEPRRPDIYSTDFWVRKATEDPKSDLVVTKIRIGPPHKRIAADDLKPLDLVSTLTPESIDAQCGLHGVQNPFAASGQQRQQCTNYPSDPGAQAPGMPATTPDPGQQKQEQAQAQTPTTPNPDDGY